MDDERPHSRDGVPVAPSLEPTLEAVLAPRPAEAPMSRVVLLTGLSMAVGAVAVGGAELLTSLIGLITNLAFFGRFSLAFVSPAGNHLGPAVILRAHRGRRSWSA